MTDLIERLRAAEDHTGSAPVILVADVVRAGEGRLRRRRVGAAVCVLTATLAVGAGTVLGRPDDRLAGREDLGVAAFGRPQELPADRLPAGILDDPTGLEPTDRTEVDQSSSRLLAQTPQVRVWAVRLTDGQVCVVAVPVAEPANKGASCTSSSGFREAGIGHFSVSNVSRFEVVLAPVGLEPPPEAQDLDPAGQGLWIGWAPRG